MLYFSSERVNSSVGTGFELSKVWENHTADWYYNVGNETRLVASFYAPQRENPGFDSGWLG